MMEKNILMYVVGPQGVGKSTLVKTFTKGKQFRKRVEGFRCWAIGVKTKETDLEQIDIYEFRGFKGDVSSGPALLFWDVHILIVLCTQHTLSETCKRYKFGFWKKENTLLYLVQNIKSPEERNVTTLENEGKQFGFSNIHHLRVSVKGEVRQFFKTVFDDLHRVHPSFRRDQLQVAVTLEDSGYASVTSSQENPRQVTSKTLETYKLDTEPKGLCIIINNEDFGRLYETRHGSHKDAESLKTLFEGLHFEVQVFKNQTHSDMKTILKRQSSRYDLGGFGCFVCCILSHGAQDVVYGSDGVPVDIPDLLRYFEGGECPGLNGKPKLFIIQACQGGIPRAGAEIDADCGFQTDVTVSKTIPVDADFLLMFSTTSGSLAFRDPQKGSPYISALVENIARNLHKSLTDILTMVNNSMSEQNYAYSGQMSKQIGCFKSTLRKRIIFKPTK